jgi:hypothetical protein
MPLIETVEREHEPGPPVPLLRVTVTRNDWSLKTRALHAAPLPVTVAPTVAPALMEQPADMVHETRMPISWPMSYPVI